MHTSEIEELNKTKPCSEALAHPGWAELLTLLGRYGVDRMETVGLIDTSYDEADIRWNYIIDKKYVLRFTNAPEMTEERFADLNRLIGRYGAFGLRCPAFIQSTDGLFFHSWGQLQVYLSEYIDLPTADKAGLSQEEKDALRGEVVLSIARFMERYKGVDLSPTMGMYSLFDLCPYDVPLGMDEKQQNLNDLCAALHKAGEEGLAQKLTVKNESVRAQLLSVYRDLPRCVTQADEGFTNVLLDGERHLAGLIDFNLSGTDVCVNLIANNAILDLDDLGDKPFDPADALEQLLAGFRRNAARMLEAYHASETERDALAGYAWIALVSQYPNARACAKRIEKDETRACTLAYLEQVASLDMNRLAV